MTLHFQKFGEKSDASPIIFIHGLFGSGTNWRSVAKEFSEGRESYVLDLRNHGKSAHLPSHTYLDLASDIQEFVISEGLTDYILCGHSMGGKAVMANALMADDLMLENRLKAIVILDIAPVAYEHSHSENLAALKTLDLSSISSRADADRFLKPLVPNDGVRLFFLQSLVREEGRFKWSLNLDILDEFMPDIVGFPNPIFDGKSFTKPALFTYGLDSDFVTKDNEASIHKYFPNSELDGIAGAGHWIHIDKRLDMIKSIYEFIEGL